MPGNMWIVGAKLIYLEAGEMSQWLRSCIALAQDQFGSQHPLLQLTTACNIASGDPMPPPAPALKCTDIHNLK